MWRLAAAGSVLWLVACATEAPPATASLSGTATYRERIALTPDAAFEATLEDVSRMDIAAPVLGRTRIASPGQPPIHFTITYNPAQLSTAGRYAVRARIVRGDDVLFVATTVDPVPGPGLTAPVEILMRSARAGAPGTRSGEAALADLPATFAGDLPCADCEALRYHLDLFEDGTYFVRTTYAGKSALSIDDIGRWALAADGRTLELRAGREAYERFEVRDAGTLHKLDLAGKPIESRLNYDLTRQPHFDPIEPGLAMRGLYSYWADAGSFTECLTGKRLAVAQEAANGALEAAYMKARSEQGAVVLASIRGRIVTRSPEPGRPAKATLIVDRFDRVSTTERCSSQRASAALEDTYWKLVHVGDATVEAAAGQREPHLLLSSADRRVGGFSGCNQLTGGYELDGKRLKFGPLAGTMMACINGMERERAFLDALGATESWRIVAGDLALLDDGGRVVAQFQSHGR
ncbi:MAG TPA: META domain-containing protein [Steroidobacteraceae bacterium]|nr:META domain-containing protein [Steroidobacteraceae bacterium]